MHILRKKKVSTKWNVNQLYKIVDSPNYEGQGTHSRPDDCVEFAVNTFT